MATQNQGNPVNPKSDFSAPSLGKTIAMAIVGIVAAFGFGLFLNLSIASGNWNPIIITAVLGLLFLSVFLLNVFFIRVLWWSRLTALLEGLALLIGFFDKFSFWIFVGAVLAALAFFWGNLAGLQELENLLKIKLWRVSKRAVPKAIIGLAVFVSLVYYANVEESGLSKPGQFFISAPTFEKYFIQPAAPFLKNFIPEFDLSMTAGDLIESMARGQIESSPQAQLLPKAAKELFVNQAAQESERQLSEWIGMPINPKSKISEVIYDAMVKKILELPAEVKNVIPAATALLIFLTIISFTWLIRWLSTFVAYLVYEILLALGFAAVMMESRSREIIVLP